MYHLDSPEWTEFPAILRPNTSRIYIAWPGGKPKDDMQVVQNKTDQQFYDIPIPNNYSLPPDKLILDIKPIDLSQTAAPINDDNSDHIDANKIIIIKNQQQQQQKLPEVSDISLPTTTSPATVNPEKKQLSVQQIKSSTKPTTASPIAKKQATRAKTTPRPRIPPRPNSIDSEELKALRPPTRRPENSSQLQQDADQLLLLEQFHAITTPKPYDPKRDCGIRHQQPQQQTQSSNENNVTSSDDQQIQRKARVVGGRNSELGEFPWSVLIRETSMLGLLVKTKCGGVLIDLKWVLTAAHCKPGLFGSLVVIMGDLEMNQQQRQQPPASYVKKVKRMIIHRDYNPSNFDNDIALLELESPFKIQAHVNPICLPEKGKYLA